MVCDENNIEHRLTKPATPKMNGMVEKANGAIKNNTIKLTEYNNKDEMQKGLLKFLMFYILYRRHSLSRFFGRSLRKELNVKTPFNAIEKLVVSIVELWFELIRKFSKKIQCSLKIKFLSLSLINTSYHDLFRPEYSGFREITL